jgi:cyclopropane fatty-acyl-phospholipid synthase-like methyltransferase
MELLSIFITFLSLLAILFLGGIFSLMMYALILGAPFATLAQNRIETMAKLLNLKKGQKIADLGSGDGRIVIAFAKLGIESHGYEINPVLVAWSRLRIRRLGLQNMAFIHFKDFWREDLSSYNAVTLYGIAHMMGRLEKKLKKEMKPGSKIVSNYFKLPNLKPTEEENKVLYYEIL